MLCTALRKVNLSTAIYKRKDHFFIYEGLISLYTSNIELAEENRMNQTGKSEYVKIVSQSEAEVFEEKKQLNLKKTYSNRI